MTWLNWEKKRALAFMTIGLAGLAHINVLGISDMLAPVTNYSIVGEIQIKTVIGLVTVILAYMLYKRKYIG